MWRSQLDFRFLVLRSGETGRGMEDREKERCRERRMAKRGCKQAALRKVNNTKLTLFHFRSHLPFFSCFVRPLFVVKIICTFLYCQQAEVRRIELTRLPTVHRDNKNLYISRFWIGSAVDKKNLLPVWPCRGSSFMLNIPKSAKKYTNRNLIGLSNSNGLMLKKAQTFF